MQHQGDFGPMKKNATRAYYRSVGAGLAERLGIPHSQGVMIALRPNYDAFARMATRHNIKALDEYNERYKDTPANRRPDFKPPFDMDRLMFRYSEAISAHL
jgi:hypothetical protein